MKQIIFIFILYSLLTNLCFAERILPNTNKDALYDINNVNWGMTKEEVKNNEKLDNIVHEDNNSILVKDRMIEGKPAVVGYGFENSKLSGILYVFQNFEPNDKVADCKKLFNKFKEIVKERYKEKKIGADINLNKFSGKEKELFEQMIPLLNERTPQYENERTIVKIEDDCIYQGGSKLTVKYSKKDTIK